MLFGLIFKNVWHYKVNLLPPPKMEGLGRNSKYSNLKPIGNTVLYDKYLPNLT